MLCHNHPVLLLHIARGSEEATRRSEGRRFSSAAVPLRLLVLLVVVEAVADALPLADGIDPRAAALICQGRRRVARAEAPADKPLRGNNHV